MSNYNSLKATINANIKQNGNQEITGPVLNSVLTSIVNSLGAGYQYIGVADSSTNPGTPDQNVAYLAGPGAYPHFGGLVVPERYLGVLKYNGTWAMDLVEGVGSGAAILRYVAVASIADLPDPGVDGTGYLVGQNLYLYVGEGGDTADGKYQDCGAFRGPAGPPTEGNGEDIDTDSQGKLQFANRPYNILTPNGLGYKILRKDATFASQVTEANTIYEIRYDFDLGGASFTMPSGCVLKFVGGRLNNGTLLGTGTKVIAGLDYVFGVSLTGTFNFDSVRPEWFGAIADGVTDCSSALQKALDLGKSIVLGLGTYLAESVLYMEDGSCLYGEGLDCVLNCRGIVLKRLNHISNLTISAIDENVDSLIEINTNHIIYEYLRIFIDHIRLVTPDNVGNNTTVAIKFHADGSDEYIGLHSVYVNNVVSEGMFYRGILFEAENNSTASWMTAMSFRDIWLYSCKIAIEMVSADKTKANVFTDISFDNVETQFNTGFTEGFVELSGTNSCVFNNCMCWDNPGTFPEYKLVSSHNSFNLINEFYGNTALFPFLIEASYNNSLSIDSILSAHVPVLIPRTYNTGIPYMKGSTLPDGKANVPPTEAPIYPMMSPCFWSESGSSFSGVRITNCTAISSNRKEMLFGIINNAYPGIAIKDGGSATDWSLRNLYSDLYVPRSNAANLPTSFSGKNYGSMLYNMTIRLPLFVDLEGGRWLTAYGARITTNVTCIHGTTLQRISQTLYNYNEGLIYYDTDLKKYVIWNGEEWTEINGRTLVAVPSGYTALEYISTDSQAYIDTGIAGASDLLIQVKFYVGTFVQYGAIYGNFIDDQHNVNRAILGSATTILVGGGENLSQSISGFSTGGVYNLKVTKDDVYLNNTRVTITKTQYAGNTTNICLGNRNTTSPTTRDIGLRIYSFTILKGGVPSAYYVPCKRDSDSAIGFYDWVSQSFKPSDTATPFAPGPEL